METIALTLNSHGMLDIHIYGGCVSDGG